MVGQAVDDVAGLVDLTALDGNVGPEGAPQDGTGQDPDPFPELLRAGQGLAFRGVKPGQSAGERDEARDGHVQWPPGDAEAVVGGAGAECRDVFLGHVPCGRVVWPLAGQVCQVPDPEGRDGVEGEARPQVVGVVEAAVFDPCSLLQGVEEPFDPPAQRRAGGLDVGPAFGCQQHPVQRPAVRRHPALRALQHFILVSVIWLVYMAGHAGWSSPFRFADA